MMLFENKTLKNWINYASHMIFKENKNYVSVHVDEVEFSNLNNINGLQLIEKSCNLLESIKQELEVNKISNLCPLIVIPLGYSKEIKFWKDLYLKTLGQEIEKTSIYLFKGNDFFNLDDEEYRVRIQNDLDGYLILYRCHRSAESVELDWEYSRDIYIIQQA